MQTFQTSILLNELRVQEGGGMKLTYRAWRCPCCNSTRRRTLTGLDSIQPYCMTCGRDLVAAHVPSTPRVCRHRRATRQIAAVNERLGRLPRTRSQLALRPPAEVRAAWREVRLAGTRPSLARRGRRFIEALLAYSRDDLDEERAARRYRRTYTVKDGRVTVHRQAGGLTDIPKIVVEKRPGIWGEYRRHLLRGVYEINLNPEHATLDDMRETLVHEVLHLLDAEAHVSAGDHGRLWQQRLDRMLRLFPPTSLRR